MCQPNETMWLENNEFVCGICHDRFIIADQREIFWTGASLKDERGGAVFAIAKMGAGGVESIRKAMAGRREYSRGKKTDCGKV